MSYHPLVTHIRTLLETHGFWFEYFEHEPAISSQAAAAARPQYSLSQGTKALIVRCTKREGEQFLAMLVLPGDKKFDSKKARQVLDVREIRFVTPEEVATITDGIQIGGVPPFGNLFGLPVYADHAVFDHDIIVCSAGDRAVSIALTSNDYQTLVAPIVCSLT